MDWQIIHALSNFIRNGFFDPKKREKVTAQKNIARLENIFTTEKSNEQEKKIIRQKKVSNGRKKKLHD